MNKPPGKIAMKTEVAPQSSLKVAPYPFKTRLTGSGGSFEAQALKLVMHGLLMELTQGVVKVGEKYLAFLMLPGGYGEFEVEVNVVRTIDRKVPAKEGLRTQRITEVHFSKPLGDKHKSLVKRFLKDIHQVGSDIA